MKAKKKQTQKYSFVYFPLVLSFFTVALLNIYSSKRPVSAMVVNEQQILLEELAFWDEIIVNYPTYRDAYLEKARVASSLGDRKLARDAVHEAYEIDPNSERVAQAMKKFGL